MQSSFLIEKISKTLFFGNFNLLFFRKDHEYGSKAIFSTTKDTKFIKCIRIPSSFFEQFDEIDGKVKGFKEKEDQKDNDDLSDKLEKNELELLSEELTETFKEDIVITKLQKFSMAKYLYKIECVNSQLETQILVNVYDKSYYKVESKMNLNSDFERKLAQNLSEVSNNSVSLELFAAIVQTMKS